MIIRWSFTANDDSQGPARARIAIRILALAMLVMFMAAAAFYAQAAEFEGRVVSVHDGDTLTVLIDSRQVRVRLVGIDAPELSQAFGRRSRDSLAGMCAGTTATIDERGRDRYGRTLGRVTCHSVDANAEQVRRGMAWVFVRYAPKNTPLYRFQAEARLDGRGLWAEQHPMSPWDWRRAKAAKQF